MAKGQIKQAQAKIDKELFEKLCRCQCTAVEISKHFGINIETLRRWCKETYNSTFEEIFEVLRYQGFTSLRAKQFAEAMKGNTTLLIFLGKNYLGQSDKVESYNEEKVVIVNDLKEDEC